MTHFIRLAAVLAAGLLTTTALVGPAQAAADDRGARWLSSQLTDGLVHNDQHDFDDYGLTADHAFGLRATGGQPEAMQDIRTALADNVNSWIMFGSDVFAGSTAKAVVLAQSTGADPRSFGGVNLVARLNARVADNGRIEDKSTDDFANTIGQAYAARGLARADSSRANRVLRFLLMQQCSSGYFRLNFAPKAKVNQTCDAGNSNTSAPDTDVTAIALMSLRAIPAKSDKVRAAISDAVAWLERRQKVNGSFGEAPRPARATPTAPAWQRGPSAWRDRVRRPPRRLDGSGICRCPSASSALPWRGRRAPSPTTGPLTTPGSWTASAPRSRTSGGARRPRRRRA